MIGKLRNPMQAFSLFAGAILIASAFFKATAPSESIKLMAAYGFPSWSSLLLIEAELFLGVLLVANITRKSGNILGIVTFVSFACFSAYRAIAGFESCGCFGAMRVHPWFTFAIDILVVVLLIWKLRQPATIQNTGTYKLSFATASFLLLSLLILAISDISEPQALAADEDVVNGIGKVVILEPKSWSGKKLPIADALLPKLNMSSGNWIILLYHHNCPNCQAALPLYEQLAQKYIREKGLMRVALIEVPPYGPVMRQRAATSLRLSDEVEWLVQAPVEIQISDGIVIGSSPDLPSVVVVRRQADSLATTHDQISGESLE